MKKQTKILATISDRRCDEDFLRALHQAGMDGVRMNTAHQSLDDTLRVVESVRKISNKIPLVLDTKGPEIRTAPKVEDVVVKAGDRILLKGDPNGQTSRQLVCVSYADFAQSVVDGTRILIDDGLISLVVESRQGDTLTCLVENDGSIGGKKSVNVPGVPIKLPSLSAKDLDYINFAIEHQIDFIAHSFVRNRQDVLDIQRLLDNKHSKCQIIAKIENQEGVDNIDEILDHVYGVMVARGDMGIEIPAEQVPSVQKMIIRKCRDRKRMVITATQMLHTMMENPRPTRAEVSDIANAVYDGTDCLMLSGETASGKYPLEAVTIMAKIARASETSTVSLPPISMSHAADPIPSFLTQKAVEACQSLPIKGIITDTSSGRTARYLSAFRGSPPIYVQCYDEHVMRQLALTYGAVPFFLPEERDTAYFVRITLSELLNNKELNDQDVVLILAGHFGSSIGASFMEISTVADQLKK